MLLSPKSFPPLGARICQLEFAMIANIYFPTCLSLAPDIIAISGQPPAIFNGTLGSPTKRVVLILLHLGTLHNEESFGSHVAMLPLVVTYVLIAIGMW